MNIPKVTAAWAEARRVFDALPYNGLDASARPSLQSLFILAYNEAARSERATRRLDESPPPEWLRTLLAGKPGASFTCREAWAHVSTETPSAAEFKQMAAWLRALGYVSFKSNGRVVYRVTPCSPASTLKSPLK